MMIDDERKMKLQNKVENGRKADEILLSYGEEWLEERKKDTLKKLLHADTDSLIGIQSEFAAYMSFYGKLVSDSREGKMAARKLHEEMRKG